MSFILHLTNMLIILDWQEGNSCFVKSKTNFLQKKKKKKSTGNAHMSYIKLIDILFNLQ